MTSRLLKAGQSVLVMVDMQTRLLPAVAGADEAVERLGFLAEAAGLLAVPVLVTEHCPDKIGSTAAGLAKNLPLGDRITKTSFAAMGAAAFRTRLAELGRRQVVIGGCEAHVCVLQTAVSVSEAGYQVFVVADAVASRRPADKEVALSRMVRAGIEIVTSEMVAFEWLEHAERPETRALIKLIK